MHKVHVFPNFTQDPRGRGIQGGKYKAVFPSQTGVVPLGGSFLRNEGKLKKEKRKKEGIISPKLFTVEAAFTDTFRARPLPLRSVTPLPFNY